MFLRTLLLISAGLLYLGPYRIVVGFPSTYAMISHAISIQMPTSFSLSSLTRCIFLKRLM